MNNFYIPVHSAFAIVLGSALLCSVHRATASDILCFHSGCYAYYVAAMLSCKARRNWPTDGRREKY